MVFKNGVKNIQGVAYNGGRTVDAYKVSWPAQTKNLELTLVCTVQQCIAIVKITIMPLPLL